MRQKLILLVFFILGLGSVTAQTFIGKINPNPVSSSLKLSAGDTLKILAVMADFQEDKDESTFGTGKFGTIYTEDYGDQILDPLPHDKSYFDEHLLFVKNYYKRVSNGKVNILYKILPDVITVSQTMRNYSPQPNSDDFTSLADFSKEVWAKADSANPGFNFGGYDVFIIFHAGVGRDVSLPGSIGNERDLPSVYLSEKTLKNIFGDDFNGFPVNGGYVPNSIIMPETESREATAIDGSTFLFELTINGLLVSSVASHLGLPDLFDTKTGLSAIGRFGLMDGEAIFGFAGVFPPEPSAWEKAYLGWADPVTVEPGNYNITLPVQQDAGPSDTTILKVPLNSTEYYLVENRNRDVNSKGVTIKYVVKGDTLTKTFTRDTTFFNFTNVDSLEGVIIDVSNFDWALPGSGILIWHVDDNIINSKIADNAINADKEHRGLFVEEADGIPDIGVEFTSVLGDIIIGSGSEEDLWYKTNPADLYKNRFSFDTRPNTATNSGANSLITFSGFSDIAAKMNFNLSFGDSLIIPIFSKQLLDAQPVKYLTASANSGLSFYLSNGSNVNVFDSNGKPVKTLTGFSSFKVAAFNSNGSGYAVGVSSSNLNIYAASASDTVLTKTDVGAEITAAPAAIEIDGKYEIALGTSDGRILIYSAGELPALTPELKSTVTDPNGGKIIAVASNNNYFAYISFKSDKYLVEDSDGGSVILPSPVDRIASTMDNKGNNVIVAAGDHDLFIIRDSKITGEVKIYQPLKISQIAIADLKNDGNNYILFTDGISVNAVNLSGASADNFPFIDPEGKGFTGQVLCADIAGDSKAEVIASTVDGRIFAVDGGSGKIVKGFPVSAGSRLTTAPVVFNTDSKASLASVNGSSFNAWNIGAAEGGLYWSEQNGNSMNTSFTGAAESAVHVNEFFPKNEAYNYPNPVYGKETKIHYYVSENSKINIKIFDLAGDLVAELNDNATGGMSNETAWDVSSIQSGVYLARIEASGSSGKTESNIIKIAIVK